MEVLLVLFAVFKLSKILLFIHKTYKFLNSSWSRFHKNDDEPQDDVQNDHENAKAGKTKVTVQNDHEDEENTTDAHGGDEIFDSSSTEEELSEEGQIEMFEKRILYMLLTLQTVYYTSEAAVEFVVSSLLEFFLGVSVDKLI